MAERFRTGGIETQVSRVNPEQEISQCLGVAIQPQNQLTTVPNSPGDDTKHLFQQDPCVSFNSWIKNEFSPWQELRLYLRIVACHASDVAFMLHERARKMVDTYILCSYYARRMRRINRMSKAIFDVIQYQYTNPAAISCFGDYFTKTAVTTLHKCIKNLRSFDLFCAKIPPRPGMNQITWDMIELNNIVSGNENNPLIADALVILLYPTERCIFDVAEDLRHEIYKSGATLIGSIYSDMLEEIEALRDNVGYIKSSRLFLEELYGPQDIVFKDLPWKNRKNFPVADRKQPRDVEMELVQFHSHTYGIEESTWLEGISARKPFVTNSKDIEKKKNAGSEDPALQNDLLVSKNYVRPKRHTIVISGNTITITRVKGSQNSTTWTIPMEEILLVTQRPSGPDFNSLTIFWSSPGMPGDIDSCGIENIKLFFNDPTLQQAWAIKLASVLNVFMRSAYEEPQRCEPFHEVKVVN